MPRGTQTQAIARKAKGKISGSSATWLPWLCILLLCGATAAAYYNSFYGVFLLDDTVLLLNDHYAHLWPPWELLKSPRPVVDLSLAINYAISELDPWSYHAFNLIVHILAAVTLFGIVRRTLQGVARRGISPQHSTLLAFAAALLWAVHPLQTQAVTYVIQRSESFMGLFYLLTLYCVLRGATSSSRIACYIAACIACALGMLTKSVMVTAPVLVLIYDRAFLAASWRETLRSRWGLYLGLAATWGVLATTGVFAGLAATTPEAKSTVGFGVAAISCTHYALTEPGVIFHYLRLAFWPHHLCLDYLNWPVTRTLAEAAVPLGGIAALLACTIAAWLWRPALGFLGAAFFLILAPTSSFIPIQDVAFEHRMYLPLAAVVILVVVMLDRLLRRAPATLTLSLVAAIPLAVRTYQRNKDYYSAVSMWRNVVEQQPKNARAHNNLAVALNSEANPDEAIAHLGITLQLAPKATKAHLGMAGLLNQQGVYEEVAREYERALALDPNLPSAHYNLANCYYQHLKRLDDAILQYREAQRLDPVYIENYIMLGNLFSDQGRPLEAIDEYRSAIAAATPKSDRQTLAKAHFNLGNSLAKLGRNDLAIDEYQEALRLNPRHYEAQYGIGYAHTRMDHIIEAVAAYRAALAINPDYAPAREALEHYVGQEAATQTSSNH